MAETFCFAYRRIWDLIFCFRLSVAASRLRRCRSRISSKTQSGRKRRSRSLLQSSLSEGACGCAYFFLVPQRNFLPVFGAFRTIPHPPCVRRHYRKGVMSLYVFFCVTKLQPPCCTKQKEPPIALRSGVGDSNGI